MADIVSQHSFQAPESLMSLSGKGKQLQLFLWEVERRGEILQIAESFSY